MLLASHIDDQTTLYIDTEVAGGFAKGDDDLGFHPDQVLDNVVKVASLVARRLAEAAAHDSEGAQSTASRLSLSFGIKVDGAAVVSVASSASAAHFLVTAEWTPQR
ncbi:hypothetical protein L6R53_04565 [Myxococcota bacterium]|nr:hypothetical protein [Myxococcota bacterium]